MKVLHSVGWGSWTWSVCFWAFRIRFRIRWSQVRLRLRILPSSSKNSKKNLDFYCFVTSLWLFIFEEWCKFTGIPNLDPDPYVSGPSGSVSQRYWHPDPYQNVTDPQHCSKWPLSICDAKNRNNFQFRVGFSFALGLRFINRTKNKYGEESANVVLTSGLSFLLFSKRYICPLFASVPNPRRFDTDPDPLIT